MLLTIDGLHPEAHKMTRELSTRLPALSITMKRMSELEEEGKEEEGVGMSVSPSCVSLLSILTLILLLSPRLMFAPSHW